MPGRIYTILHDHSLDQNGYLTTRQVQDLGVDAHRLEKMKQRGLLQAVSRGVVRFNDVPAGPLDQYIAATLWPLEIQGILSHATALDLHELCDINPSRIDITVPASFRTTRTPPDVMRLHREDLPDSDLTWHEGLPTVTVERAIRGSVELGVGWNLIEQAIDTARKRGRLTAAQAAELRALRPRDPRVVSM